MGDERTLGDSGIGSEASPPQPDHAWKALTVTNEWIRHADAKTGVTLAFAGATAAVMFNLVNRDATWTCALKVAVVTTSLALAFVAVCGGVALVPRVKRERPSGGEDETVGRDDAVNLLFFGDVHRKYGEDPPTYREVLGTLTSDPARLTGQVADQIHANASIATVKFQWANRAIVCELAATVAVAVTALLVATGW
jgi:hypothetical protein